MTTHHKHSGLGAWLGLGIGLALAWGGWMWWSHTVAYMRPMGNGATTGPVPWYDRGWVGPTVIATLTILAVLCAVAGAMIGRRVGN